MEGRLADVNEKLPLGYKLSQIPYDNSNKGMCFQGETVTDMDV
jgi:hypothetical protein